MKKIISKVLLAALLLNFASAAISCGENPTETTPTDTNVGVTPSDSVETEASAGEEEIGVGNILERFEQTSFNGVDFRVVGSKYYNTTIGGRQFPDEEINGEVLNDELIRRDQLLEEYFDINIAYNMVEYEDWGELSPMVNQNVSAGDDFADMLFGSLELTLKPLLSAGCLVNLTKLPHLDFSNEWWHKTVTEDLNFSGKVFFASGDITPRAATSAFVVGFNNKLLTDYQIDAPYDAVREGQWTMDLLQTICTDVYQDVDESGNKSAGDFYGLVFEGGSLNAFYTGAGGTIFELQPDGMPFLTADNEKNVGTIERISTMMQTGDFYSPSATYVANQIFRESRALFISFACCDLSMLREMEDDYGLLPLPKLDEVQENYSCTANRWIATGVAVPKSLPVSEYERVGLLTEAMAALSTYTSYAAQYEDLMQAKYVRDTESIEMIRLAVASTKYDLGTIYGWGNLHNNIESMLINGGPIVSQIEKMTKAASKQMEVFVEKVSEFE